MLTPPYAVKPSEVIVQGMPAHFPFEELWFNLAKLPSQNIEPIQSARTEMVTLANQFVDLGPGWLGAGSCEVPVETARRIIALASSLTGIEGLPNPEMTPNINGTISLEWESPRGEAYLEYGTNQISGFVRVEDNPTEYLEQISSLPAAFFEDLRDRLFPISQSHSVMTEGAGPYSYAFAETVELV